MRWRLHLQQRYRYSSRYCSLLSGIGGFLSVPPTSVGLIVSQDSNSALFHRCLYCSKPGNSFTNSFPLNLLGTSPIPGLITELFEWISDQFVRHVHSYSTGTVTVGTLSVVGHYIGCLLQFCLIDFEILYKVPRSN